MMRMPNKKALELHFKIAPWLIPGEVEGQPAKLKEDAPEEIKEAYEEWLRIA